MAFFNTTTRWYLLWENTMVFLFYCGYFVLKHHILLMNNLIFWSFDQRNLKVFDSNILRVYTKTLQKLHLLTLILTILTKILVGKKVFLRKYNYNFHFLDIILCTDRGWKPLNHIFTNILHFNFIIKLIGRIGAIGRAKKLLGLCNNTNTRKMLKIIKYIYIFIIFVYYSFIHCFDVFLQIVLYTNLYLIIDNMNLCHY